MWFVSQLQWNANDWGREPDIKEGPGTPMTRTRTVFDQDTTVQERQDLFRRRCFTECVNLLTGRTCSLYIELKWGHNHWGEKSTVHLIFRLVVSWLGHTLVHSIGPHRLRRGGHIGRGWVSRLLRGWWTRLFLLLELTPWCFLHCIHPSNDLSFLLSLQRKPAGMNW